MAGFTKLYAEITDSSIWNEADKNRIVWVTLLARMGPDSIVRASVGGLAHLARVPRKDTEKALKLLESPDPDSRSADFEGRRIERVEGGFLILNGPKYREARSQDERRAYMREYMREYRKKRKQDANVNDNVSSPLAPLAQAEAEVEAEVEAEKKVSSPSDSHPDKSGNLRKLAEEIYQAYPRKVAKPAGLRAIGKALAKLTQAEEEHGAGFEFLLVQTTLFKKARVGQNPGLTPHPATWFNQERYNDDPETWADADTSKKPANPNQVHRGVPPQKKVGDFS